MTEVHRYNYIKDLFSKGKMIISTEIDENNGNIKNDSFEKLLKTNILPAIDKIRDKKERY